MEISYLDFILINLLSYITGLGTGLIICCKHKDKFFDGGTTRELDNIQVSDTYPIPQADIISTPQVDHVNKGIKITLE